MFPYAKLNNLEGSPSNHSSIFLDTINRDSGTRKFRFRFENAWLTEPLCSTIIRDNWESSIFANIQLEIQLCADSLSVRSKEITGCFNKRI